MDNDWPLLGRLTNFASNLSNRFHKLPAGPRREIGMERRKTKSPEKEIIGSMGGQLMTIGEGGISLFPRTQRDKPQGRGIQNRSLSPHGHATDTAFQSG